MINIFDKFKKIFEDSIKEIALENNLEINDLELKKISVEPAKEKSHGDFACNAAMVLSKKFATIESLNNPRKLAQNIIEKINKEKHGVKNLEIAGAGFINIFIEDKILLQIIADLLTEKKFTFPNLGNKEKINLEYASPNPTGPIHVGHCRGAIYGDVLANLLTKCNYDVLKEYYINDAGAQINTLVKSAYIRYLQALGKDIEISEGLYPGEYLIEIGSKIKEKFGNSLQENDSKLRDFVVDEMLSLIKSDLLALGIKHDSYFSEKKELHDKNKIDEIIENLKQKNLIYVGKLEAPKTEKGVGALPEGYSNEDQTLFRSTLFGDDQDRVVKKSDGAVTYFAADLAYVQSKINRGATKLIMPLGFDHAGYIKRLNAAVEVISDKKAELKVILCQMVKFVKNGQPLKMSKRAGNFITARQVIDEVGPDVLRFIMLTRKNDAPFDFDLNKVVEQSKDNPIFYVQYAHARCCSVLRLCEKSLLNSLDSIQINDLEKLQDESEIEIIKKIIFFPELIKMSVSSYEPHRIAFYLQELAALFHSLWNKGVENPHLKFIIKDDAKITKARILLIMAIKMIISSGLEIFNIKALEEMR